MMKGTPCSSRDRTSLKTLGKLSYSHRRGNPAKRVRAWALVGCKRGHIGKSASRAIATYSATSNDRLTSTPVFGRNAHIAVIPSETYAPSLA
jgi:hypothetical protein